ncbi:hypothetical protein JL09_g5369 [Pichia kudriavzevii]|uniref:60S ribosomal protein L41 n=1 Tax=Pichia kudriavzevii TaxID=4909 RepID=A0A099NUC3_PICKU|nr:hypothetical protein JL09_g5369 [Pichia kudriavzevii]
MYREVDLCHSTGTKTFGGAEGDKRVRMMQAKWRKKRVRRLKRKRRKVRARSK